MLIIPEVLLLVQNRVYLASALLFFDPKGGKIQQD
jgi:hypothetical protein